MSQQEDDLRALAKIMDLLLHPAFMTDIADAYESAYTIMMNLNRTWV